MDKGQKTSWFMRILGGEASDKKMKAYRILLFVLIGIAIMIFSSFLDITEQAIPSEPQTPTQETSGFIDKNSTPKTMQDYEKLYENQLTEVLTSMIGLDEVIVKVNLESTEEVVYERNTTFSEQITKEKDKQGGTREVSNLSKDEQVVLIRVDNNEQPLVIKTLKPKVRGVIVFAKGAENVRVKAMIIEAVQRLLDVPPHRIGILPRKS